ncbi:efflux RND transporter periplasmic adaptor subunit [Geobacter sp. DSM 9736]|uniref:efflux RND transporter periplasmic adaptor subunit n=1 Tax=Geobacter sp. DSM 9736 TaxID=1277350 RepID=UPI000B509749|nr:efflux RND transporter periplasmic adaptor subunit [Geobacter sp. DSM 9736]SNB44767.1 RND family efflux transporter, MFP subunit [Geobacter sp. DSM 9736]
MKTWRIIYKYLPMLLLSAALFAGCTSREHGDTHSANEHEEEKVQITAYSDKSEVFMEFAEPVAGEKTDFLIHLTRLADWKPVNQGSLKLVFTPAAGAPASFTIPAPARPGIYQAGLTLAKEGEYSLAIIPEGTGFADTITIPHVHVVRKGEAHAAHEKGKHPETPKKEEAHQKEHAESEHDDHDHEGATEEAHHGETEEAHHGEEVATVITGTGGGTIPFLKEQQWVTEFMTQPAVRKDLATYFSTMGELLPVSNAEAIVSAPLAGIISGSKSLPFIGKKVTKGEIVAYIEPPVRQEGGMGQLTAGYAEARNRVALAQKEYDRAKRLYEAKIAPLKRVEEAELTLSSAKAALEPLERAVNSIRGDAGNGRIAVRAPVGGTVVEINAANGKGVEAGQPILRVVNTGTLWLKANLPAADAGKAALASGATFTITGLDGEFRPSRLVTVGDMLDPQTRTLPVIFEVPNPGARLKVGMFANVAIRTGEARNALTVPKEALVEDESRWFVFVQTSGEAFERREVKIGAQDKGHVQVVEGLQPHERVVTKGAYYVKLAATAGKGADPHAGHAH